MKYLCLIYDDENRWQNYSEEEKGKVFAEHTAVWTEAQEKGAFLGGEGLSPSTSATQVRVREGKTVQTDGPFIELKEQLGGFYLFDCENLDEAVALAAKIPEARTGTVEIRPCMVYNED